MSDLAITQRCLDDDLAALPLEVATRVITAFEERRGLDPQSGETMSRVGGRCTSCTPTFRAAAAYAR